MTNVNASEYSVEMKKAPNIDYLALPRESHLNIRVPERWKAAITADWKRAQGQPGGERLRTLTDYVIERLTPR